MKRTIVFLIITVLLSTACFASALADEPEERAVNSLTKDESDGPYDVGSSDVVAVVQSHYVFVWTPAALDDAQKTELESDIKKLDKSTANGRAFYFTSDSTFSGSTFGLEEDPSVGTYTISEGTLTADGKKVSHVLYGKRDLPVPPSAPPTVIPSVEPSVVPSVEPSVVPSVAPSIVPSVEPSTVPSASPSTSPSVSPSASPSATPAVTPTPKPSTDPGPSPAPSPLPQPTSTPTVGTTPETGDNSNVLLFGILGIISMAVTIASYMEYRRSRE